MKTTNSFILFGRAFRNAKKDFWVSIQVLLVATVCVAVIFYFVEHTAQPEEYRNPWDAFVWAITRYIGDPGHFAGKGPITLTGRYIDTFIGILKILIFAVPAGLVANGFRKAMDDDKKARHLEECRGRIRKSFRRQQTKKEHYRVVPRRVSVITLQAKKGMSENDIIDTVSAFDEFRLRNLATSQVADEHPQDRLVIEMLPLDGQTVDGFPIEHTEYGIKINRNSNVTIVTPSAATENTIGHIGYYLAQFGSFNYVSREFVEDVDEPVSYYTINDEQKEHIEAYIADIKSLSRGKGHWNIILISADNVHDTQVHLIHQMKEGEGVKPTNINEEQFQRFYASWVKMLETNHQLSCDLDEKYRPVGRKNVAVRCGGGTENSSFTLRLSYGITTWTDNWADIVVDMAKDIKQYLEAPERQQFAENPAWKEQGNGYGKKLTHK